MKIISQIFNESYFLDSLLYSDPPVGNVTDAESCFQIQCNQIFIGMVTMQYQAMTDMVSNFGTSRDRKKSYLESNICCGTTTEQSLTKK